MIKFNKKMIIKLIPPIVLDIIQSKQHAHKYVNYKDALKLCTESAYEENELIEVILKKTITFKKNINKVPISTTSAFSLLSLINPIISNKNGVINVLDFGGACGAHYFQAKTVINDKIKINWAVVETPTMVKHAKQLETEELRFFDNFKNAFNNLKNIDLLHTSGTLQCVDRPFDYLNEIINSNAEWILFNRLGLNRMNRDVVSIHSSKLSWNGVGGLPEGHKDRWIKYPFTFISESSFMEALEKKYTIVAKFDDTSGMYPIHGEEIIGYGLLCKKK